MISFLLMNWRTVALAVVLAGAGITVGVTKWQLSHVRADLAEVQANYKVLSVAAQECTDSVAKMEEAEKRASKNAQEAIKSARVYADKQKQSAASIARSEKPEGGSDYEATVSLVNSAIRGSL